MSTSRSDSVLDDALANIPTNFRRKIVDTYIELKRRQREASIKDSFDAAGLSVGKFCESVIRFLQSELTGSYTPFGKHIPNFPDECRKLITVNASAGPESIRVLIPRSLAFLYTLRGKRGIGHVGGDVEANEIDLATMVRTCDWILCELLRVFHNLPLEDAQALVDSLAFKQLPIVWEVAGKRRLLCTDFNFKEKVLVFLYAGTDSSALTEELFEWSEHSRLGNFRRDVLRPLHNAKLIEYDESDEIVYLSPLGINEVESKVLRKLTGT